MNMRQITNDQVMASMVGACIRAKDTFECFGKLDWPQVPYLNEFYAFQPVAIQVYASLAVLLRPCLPSISSEP